MILNIQIDTSKTEDIVLLEKFVAMINAAEGAGHSVPDPSAKKPTEAKPKAEKPKAEEPKAEAQKAEAPAKEVEKPAPAEESKAEAPTEPGSDVSLKDLQLLLQTKGDGNRALIKGKLVELGAKSMSTLDEKDYPTMYSFLKGLK